MKTKFLSLLFIFFIGHCVTAQVTDKKRPVTNQDAPKKHDYTLYKGNYTSAEDKDGILLYVNEEKLMAKIPQQPSMVLEHVSKNTFKAEKEGIIIEFSSDYKMIALKRKESVTYLTRT